MPICVASMPSRAGALTGQIARAGDSQPHDLHVGGRAIVVIATGGHAEAGTSTGDGVVAFRFGAGG
jgi:glucose dehydrogenase